MLRALSVIPVEALAEELAAHVREIPELRLVRSSASYPSQEAVLQAIRVDRPDFLFVYVNDLAQLESFLLALDDLAEGMPVIGLGTQLDANLTLRLMHLGLREYLTYPIEAGRLAEAVGGVREHLKKHPMTTRKAVIHSFLPVKPGVGTSTIALAASSVLANDLGVRTLLIDGDLYSGPVRFLLKLGATASFLDALEHSEGLDEELWKQMVGRYHKLEVLHSGERMTLPAALPPQRVEQMLVVARSLYDVICADLCGLDPISMALLEESKQIFLVTTRELAPLHFAKVRVKQLTELGMKDRLRLVLNHDHSHHKSLLTNAQLEDAVGIPISFTIPHAYDSVQRAILDGEPVPHATEMAKCIQALTHAMLPMGSGTVPPRVGKRFLEFFRVQHSDEPAGLWRS
jgi:Flp pilus assembly CpaE family ATPase